MADLNQNGPSMVLTLADDRLIIIQSTKGLQRGSRRSAAASQWCHDTGSLITQDKPHTLWYTLDKRASVKAMPAVAFDGAVGTCVRADRHAGKTAMKSGLRLERFEVFMS